jgi:hypothetical protein
MNQMFRVYKKREKKSIMRNEIPVLNLIIVAPRNKATCIPFKQLIKQFCIWHMLMTVMINRYNMYKLSDLTYVRSLNWRRTRLVSSNFIVHCHLNVTPYRVEVQSLFAIMRRWGAIKDLILIRLSFSSPIKSRSHDIHEKITAWQ